MSQSFRPPPDQASTTLDLRHDQPQDRLLLTLHQRGQPRQWWLTRVLTLRWVSAWLEQLQAVPLPEVPLSFLPTAKARDLAQEHALSLEFEGPKAAPQAGSGSTAQSAALCEEVKMELSPLECRLELHADQHAALITLTRRDAHCLLEMLALVARQAGWLDAPDWPAWLGRAQT
ncbi:MAG: hypothetical protein RJA36_1056 [Pseudomonadota bacterium]|jgi:hypothetical protein